MTSDAFGQISQGKINILRQATFGIGPDAQNPQVVATTVMLPHYVKDTSTG